MIATATRARLGTANPQTLKAGIFDVDSVLLASPHERAWREALVGIAEPERFTAAMDQAAVAGKPRLSGARAALEALGRRGSRPATAARMARPQLRPSVAWSRPPDQVVPGEQVVEATLEAGEPVKLVASGQPHELRSDRTLRVSTEGVNGSKARYPTHEEHRRKGQK